MSKSRKWTFLVLGAFLVLALGYVLFRTFFFVVLGGSMLPTYRSYNMGFVNPFVKNIDRKDVVVFRDPSQGRRYLIGRIIGLPSEHLEIKNGDVYVDGEVLGETEYWSDESVTQGSVDMIMKSDEYYVLGDNRVTARDSRVFGPVSAEDIRGEFIYLPFLK